jgi:hypothetical protein
MKRAVFVFTPIIAAILLLLPQSHHAQTLLTGANRPSTQTDVSGSRSFGVPYHNTLTTPLFVNISLLCGAGSVALSTDASSTPTTIVAASTNGTVVSNYQFVSGIVLPGNYYQATNACSGTTTYWIEWH